MRPSALGKPTGSPTRSAWARRRVPSVSRTRSPDDLAQGSPDLASRGAGRSQVNACERSKYRQSPLQARLRRSRSAPSGVRPVPATRAERALAGPDDGHSLVPECVGWQRAAIAQSRAFLRAPGIEPLYSGVAIRTASALAISCRSTATARGAGTLSRSSSYAGNRSGPARRRTRRPGSIPGGGPRSAGCTSPPDVPLIASTRIRRPSRAPDRL